MGNLPPETCLYDLLEVSSTASLEEIESSYRRIISYLNADSLAIYTMLESDKAAELRSEVDEAFRTLSDPERRAAYDRAQVESGNYPALLVPDPGSDANVSMGHLDPRRKEAASMGSPLASRPSTGGELSSGASEATDGPQTPNRCAPAPAKPAVRRLRPTLAIELTEDTEFNGSLLRRLRESAEATLQDVADITKISRRYLAALEENDFSALPPAVYVRGFVSEYARILGLDANVVAKSYMALYQRYKGTGGPV